MPGMLRRISRIFQQIFSHSTPSKSHTSQCKDNQESKEAGFVRATGIVRRIDELGRVVIPKEIRRTLRIREGDPSQMTWEGWQKFCFAMCDLGKRNGWK